MGTSYHTYLGPSILCNNAFETAREEKRGCQQPSCPKRLRSVYDPKIKFCGACGTTFTPWYVPQQSPRVDLYELFQRREPLSEIPNDYLPPDLKDRCVILIPNQRRNAPRVLFQNSRYPDEPVQFLTPDQVQAEKDWFTTAFAAELEVVRSAYGAENVEVVWGLLQYAY